MRDEVSTFTLPDVLLLEISAGMATIVLISFGIFIRQLPGLIEGQAAAEHMPNSGKWMGDLKVLAWTLLKAPGAVSNTVDSRSFAGSS